MKNNIVEEVRIKNKGYVQFVLDTEEVKSILNKYTGTEKLKVLVSVVAFLKLWLNSSKLPILFYLDKERLYHCITIELLNQLNNQGLNFSHIRDNYYLLFDLTGINVIASFPYNV